MNGLVSDCLFGFIGLFGLFCIIVWKQSFGVFPKLLVFVELRF